MKTALQLAKEGIGKQELLSVLTNTWEISPYLQKRLGIGNYFLRKWDADFVREEIQDGTIYYMDTPYCVIYRSCSPGTLKNHLELRISFRESDIGNFAIIQPVLEY